MAFDHAPLRNRPAADVFHRGVLYRSKLEAQWAAFLEAMGIVHIHEAQTFVLSPGVYFTPTFWLPQLRVWLEVAPADEAREAERWKAELFARQHPEARVWLSSGAPRAGEWHVEQLAGAGRAIARALMLADAGRPGDRVWICGTNDEDSGRLVFDSIDIGRPNHAPGFGGSRPADPNSDPVMRIAYAHSARAGEAESDDTMVSLGAMARRKMSDLHGRGMGAPVTQPMLPGF